MSISKDLYCYSQVPNKRVLDQHFQIFPHPDIDSNLIIIVIFLYHPARLAKFSPYSFIWAYLFNEICSKYPPYSFIWPYSFNWHLRVLINVTVLVFDNSTYNWKNRTVGAIFILRKDIGVGGWSRKWQYFLTLCNKNVLTTYVGARGWVVLKRLKTLTLYKDGPIKKNCQDHNTFCLYWKNLDLPNKQNTTIYPVQFPPLNFFSLEQFVM